MDSSAYISQFTSNALVQKDLSSVSATNSKLANTPAEKIEKAAEDFEAVFMTQMVKHMFENVETNEVFGGGHGEDVMKTLLFDEYGKAISKAGGIGIAQHVQRELLATQEVANDNAQR